MDKEFNPQEMDSAATSAEQELTNALTDRQDELAPGIDYMINWWYRWYLQTGHKRLGRMLVNMAKEQS